MKSYHNKHAGRSAVLFLSGPTLAKYVEPEPDLIKCGVNTVMFHRQDLDYFFIQDVGKPTHEHSYVRRKEEYDAFKPRIAKFYGTTLCKALKSDNAIPYEFTHGRIIQTKGARIEDPAVPADFSDDLANKAPAAAGSVAFPALQFLLWTGVKKIYIVGADITDGRRIGEAKAEQNYVAQNHLGRWREFEAWVKQAYPAVEIIPLNPVGLLGMFGTKQTFRFHCLAVPHTVTSPEFAHCAFTQKVRRFCKFMTDAGHTIYHYGHERSEVECTEHITVSNDDTIAAYADWKNTSYNGQLNDACNKEFSRNAIRAVKDRFKLRDFILCWYGVGHKKVADAFPTSIAVEPGIGSFNSFAPFRVFESYTLMHMHYGKYNMRPRNYDAVIPSYLDPTEFIYDPSKKEDWLLFLGRVQDLKGVKVAIDIARRTGRKLKIAGQGTLDVIPGHVEMVGYADIPTKAELLSKAAALVQPSLYAEPFGNNVIEAGISGTPVITSDWGAFAENVLHGITGWRCRNMDQFDWAVRHIDTIDPETCRNWAFNNFTLKQAHERYEEYFKQLHGVFHGCDYNGSDPSRKAIVGPTRVI